MGLLASPLLSYTNFQSDSAAHNRKWEISIEGGGGGVPFGLWKERYSIRAGISYEIHHSIWGHVYWEYRRYDSYTILGDHWKTIFVRSYPRTDVAAYLSLTVFGFFQYGVGAVAQFHEDMLYQEIHWSLRPNPPYDTLRAIRGLKPIFVVGIKYDIPLWYDFYVPVGFYIGYNGITLRGGLSKRF